MSTPVHSVLLRQAKGLDSHKLICMAFASWEIQGTLLLLILQPRTGLNKKKYASSNCLPGLWDYFCFDGYLLQNR